MCCAVHPVLLLFMLTFIINTNLCKGESTTSAIFYTTAVATIATGANPIIGAVAVTSKAANFGFAVGKVIFSKDPLNEFVEVAVTFAAGKVAGVGAGKLFRVANKAGLTKFVVRSN